MLRIMAVSFLCLFAASGLFHAGEPIDKETVAAYEKLGAIYGGIKASEFGFLQFSEGAEAARKRLPGFKFKELPNDKLPRLPDVKVPFGLGFLSIASVTDAGLKEIANLQQLASLDLAFTP